MTDKTTAERDAAQFTACDMATASAQGFRDGRASLPQPGAQEAVAWMRRDGMRAMVANEKDGWIAEGRANIVEDYTKPLYAAPQPALSAGWVSVDERLPGEQGQDSEQVLVFINGHCKLTDTECRQGGAWGLRLGYFDADRQAFRVHGRPEPHITHWRQEPAAPSMDGESNG